MDAEFFNSLLRESISSVFLLIVLIGGYRLLNRGLDVVDKHLGAIERSFKEISEVLDKFFDSYNERN